MSPGSQINHFLRSPDTREQSLAGDFHFFYYLDKNSTQQYIYTVYLHWRIHLYITLYVTPISGIEDIRHDMTWESSGSIFLARAALLSLHLFFWMSTHFSRVYLLRFLRLPAPLPNVLCRPSWKHSGLQGHIMGLHVAEMAVGQVMSKLSFFGGHVKNNPGGHVLKKQIIQRW